MSTNYAPRGDWRFEDGPQGPRVVIPTRMFWPILLFMAVWLTGWTAGECSAIKSLLSPGLWFGKLFLLVWLTGWTFGGAFAWLVALVCSGLVSEVLYRDGQEFCRRWQALGLHWTFRHQVSAMGPIAPAEDVGRPQAPAPSSGGALTVSDDDEPLRPPGFSAEQGGSWRAGKRAGGLQFKYAGKTITLGVGLDEGQTARLLEVLRDRLRLPVKTSD